MRSKIVPAREGDPLLVNGVFGCISALTSDGQCLIKMVNDSLSFFVSRSLADTLVHDFKMTHTAEEIHVST